ncbi:hypothetical protein C4J81_09520 [Deltaproteobacteria bacterium Smac51]|nr:hypothetical protein C4J81_09520 [Deltaproteobacteria bacterium Smac51]
MNGSFNGGDLRKALFLAAGFFLVMAFSNVSYFLPVYYSRLGYSPEAAGLLVASFYISSLIIRPFMGGVLQFLGFRRLLVLAGIISVVSSVGVAAAGESFWAAFLSRAALGVGSSFFQIGLATYQAIAFDESIRGRAYSLIMAGSLLPVMTLLPLADWLLYRQLDFYYICLPIITAALAMLLMPFIPGLWSAHLEGGRRKNPLAGLGECFRLPLFPLAFFSMFLFCLSDAASAFMAAMTSHYGLMASFFLSSNALIGVCVRLFCGRLLDRFPRWILSMPMIMITAGTLFLASINPSQTSLIALGLIFGIGMGFGFPLHLALMSDGVPLKLQPQAMSLTWFLMGLDFAVVPLLMGWLGSQIGPVDTFRLICGLTLAGSCLSGVLWFRKMRN